MNVANANNKRIKQNKINNWIMNHLLVMFILQCRLPQDLQKNNHFVYIQSYFEKKEINQAVLAIYMDGNYLLNCINYLYKDF